MKLVVLTNILTPYRIPLFQSMQQHVQNFAVLLMAHREENRLWELGQGPFNSEVLPGFHMKPMGADVSLHINYGVMRALRKLNPDVVLSGGFTFANLSALLYCKCFRKKYVAWAHLTLRDGSHSSWFRRCLRRIIVGWADGSVAESSDAREAFIHFGANPNRVLTLLMPLPVAFLHNKTMEFRSLPECKAMQEKYSRPILLSIGQIIRRKGYQELLDIYSEIVKVLPHASLVIVGDGPRREQYERYSQDRGWKNVHFIGYIQTADVYKYLASSDVFVFHTLYDPFGLVLSEAMAAELPVVSSIYASSTRDLVEDGVTGFRIDPMDSQSSSSTILKALSLSSQERAAIGKAAYYKTKQCDTDLSADSIVKFLRSLR